jgi:hypothetical protein
MSTYESIFTGLFANVEKQVAGSHVRVSDAIPPFTVSKFKYKKGPKIEGTDKHLPGEMVPNDEYKAPTTSERVATLNSLILEMGRPTGLEPATTRTTTEGSTN